jgi:phosphotransferase system enzyme I (PtsI)
LLAKECDFLSIGTNDLVQYALAVDRSNHAMSSLYTPTHPSVIRLIKLIINEANHHGIPVTICGEVAADPRFTPLLLGLGVHELSVTTRFIPTVKHAIRNTSIVAASQLAEAVLGLTTAADVQDLLSKEYQKNVPEDSFYNY